MKKIKFNGQLINRIKDNFSIKEKISKNILTENDIPSKLKVNLAPNLKSNMKKNNKKNIIYIKNFYNKIILNNLYKYNASPKEKNIMTINNLIKCKGSHFLAKFKDYLISDYIDEFLRRIYSKSESLERMPKLYIYYKNYLKFFCKPTFKVSFANVIIKNYGDLNAEYFYKNNLDKKKSKEKGKLLNQKINENNNDNNNINEISLENKFKPSVGKIVFTKSIKNSIDNAYIDDFSLSEKKNKKNNQNDSESIVKIFGNDDDENNLMLNNNSLLLMINEIKDDKKGQNSNKKCKIREKTIKMNNNNNNRYTFIETTSNKQSNNIKKRNNNINRNISNLEKANTYMNNFHIESLQNMVYSPKSNKKGVFFLKKDNNNKLERNLSPKTGKPKIEKIPKSQNSIIVNINININTNQEAINNNKNILNSNLIYKSPSHNISKSKKIFSFSPISTSVINNYNNDKPLLSARNQESKKLNYIKIIKRPNNYNNIQISTDRNRRNNETIQTRTLNTLESFDFNKNNSCNKDNKNLFYNKQVVKKKNKENNNGNNKKTIVNKKELCSNLNTNNINKNIYFSPNKFGKSIKLNSINKIDTNNNKFIYQKKSNNSITSPINKTIKSNKKFFQTKKV